MKTIFITGGAGFIGSALVRQCLAVEDWRVVNLDKLTYAADRLSLADINNNSRHVFVEGDVADATLVGRLFEKYRPSAIVHLAAETHVDRSIDRPPSFATTNVVGSCVLLDVATHYWQQLDAEEQQTFRCLLVSTDEVFGTAEADQFFDEQSPLAPNSPYAASKAAAEHFARAFAQTYGLPILIANPTNNYGPRQHVEKLIPKMIVNAAANESLPLYGDGLHQRDWLHVDDCCRALLAILNGAAPGDRYVVGGNHCVANLRVVETICDLVDEYQADDGHRRQLITHVTDRLGHDRRYAVDHQRLRTTTGWEPQVAFDEGLRETVRWYLDHPGWVEQFGDSSE